MNRYRTSEIAAVIGIHPNTVRLYEGLELIPKPQRQANGYRFTTVIWRTRNYTLTRKLRARPKGMYYGVPGWVSLSALEASWDCL